MESLYVWPSSPLASLAALWFVSVVLLWAARSAMLQFLKSFGEGLADGFDAIGRRCVSAADEMQESNREVLLAAGTRDAQSRLDHELQSASSCTATYLKR